MKHVVLFSGGIGSWAAARRLRDSIDDPITLLFTDTLIEDEDLYRFIEQAAADVDGELVRLAEGRTPWDVFFDDHMIGNNRAAICSRKLKRELAREWFEANTDPYRTLVYLGIDWTEDHRYRAAIDHWKPWTLLAPMCDPPYVTKPEMLNDLERRGIEPPRLYKMGFPHNNCGGFCVRAGHGTFAKLLEHFPERYHEHENEERLFRAKFGKDVAILRDRTGGPVRPLTLQEFRERLESNQTMTLDFGDYGGCGCMVDEQ